MFIVVAVIFLIVNITLGASTCRIGMEEPRSIAIILEGVAHIVLAVAVVVAVAYV
jgi:hypothetical protein